LDKTGSYQVKFQNNPFQNWQGLEILDTDYKTYSVVYSSFKDAIGALDGGYAWILTRSPLDFEKDKEEIARITEIADKVL